MKRWRAAGIFFLFIAAVCAGLLFLVGTSGTGDMSLYRRGESEKPEKETAVKIQNPVNWEKLKKANPDAYAWVYVPGTSIDYPVLQSGEGRKEDYYLHHALSGAYSFAGSIYSRKTNAKDFSDKITVLYGHNMINGSMFAGIRKFEDKTFLGKHQYFYIYTPESIRRYRILSYVLTGDEDILAVYRSNKKACLDEIKGESIWEIKPDDLIVTLSTCGSAEHSRRILSGILAETQTTK